MKSALHVVCMALNFIHAGFRPVPAEALRRPPSDLHVSVFKRVAGYLKASCRLGGATPFCAGRRGTHLVARLGELLSFLSSVGLEHGAYLSAEGSRLHSPVPHSDGGPDCLRPYRPLDADGIVLHGTGILVPFWVRACGSPTSSRDCWRLCRGLALLHPASPSTDHEPFPCLGCTRVFGAFKAKDRFRQIGDRRGQNSFESYLEGVSQELAAGFMLTRLTAPRFSHQLHGSTTDRRDFYTQCAVSRERAHTNAVKPCFRLRDFVGLRAHKDYCDWVRSLPSSALGSSPSRSRSALLCPSRTMHACFSSLFQCFRSGVRYGSTRFFPGRPRYPPAAWCRQGRCSPASLLARPLGRGCDRRSVCSFGRSYRLCSP